MENEFGISRKSIRLWETQKDEIMNNSNKKIFDYQAEEELL